MKSQLNEGALSLEETRLLNIARNNDFLKNLFGAPSAEGAGEKADQSMVSKDEPKAQMEKWVRFDEEFAKAKRSVTEKYPSRRTQIEDIAGYLNPDFKGAPALVLYGPSGSGKSSLCSALLVETAFPHIVLPCAGFTHSRHFTQHTWDVVKDSLKAYRIALQDRHETSISLGHLASKRTAKFSDFVLYFGALIDKILDASGLALNPQEECFYVVLDGLHHLCALDSVLADSLLNLSQHCHKRIKVIALSDSALANLHTPTLSVHLPAHTEQQLSVIVLQKVEQSLLLPSSQSEETGEEREKIIAAAVVRWELLPSSGRGKVRRGPEFGKAVTQVQEQVASVAEKLVVEKICASFKSMMSVALPILMSTLTHPGVLHEAAVASFACLYGDTPPGLSAAIFAHYFRVASPPASRAAAGTVISVDTAGAPPMMQSPPTRKSSRSASNTPSASQSSPPAASPAGRKRSLASSSSSSDAMTYAVDEPLLARLTAHYLPSATLERVRAAVKLVHHLPSYATTPEEVLKLARRKGTLLPRPALQLPEGGSGAPAAMTAPAPAPAPAVAKQPSDLERLDTTSMRMDTWCQFCPIRVRYLIIACFLAGHNPKESDGMKFVGEQMGKRKKQRAGTDNDADLNTAGNKVPPKVAAASGIPIARYFSLERMLSIYSQMVSIVEGRRAHGHGTVSIYATLKSLVEKGLLLENANWSVEKPMYLSCVTYDTASKLSQMMKFELQDFMYNSSNGYHTSSFI